MGFTDKELQNRIFVARELQNYHAPYEREYGFYNMVQLGDVANLRKTYLAVPIYEKGGLGTLSESETRSIRYHVIISVAMITRYCIEGGMDPETAYHLSDLYIQRADLCRNKEELGELHREMAVDYASRMRKMQKEKVFSKHIVVCMEYVYEHLHEKIVIRDLAERTGLHENYLSHLFKHETGVTILQYIQDKKLEQAEYMLKHTNESVSDIANQLSFSSQSYFIQVFKKKNGSTPKEYRNRYFRKNLKNDMKG